VRRAAVGFGNPKPTAAKLALFMVTPLAAGEGTVAMRAVVQRVASASVRVNGVVVGEVGRGLLVFLCAMEGDTASDAQWLCRKLVGLRVFADADGRMNLDLGGVSSEGSGVLVVSQFTLSADLRPKTAKGNRPAFTRAMAPGLAAEMVASCVELLRAQLVPLGHQVQTGQFGADMAVSLVNDGPVTLIFDTRDMQGVTDG
jgi:D-tyrosyl-tRNA(Tyr) deacylase